MVEKDVNSSTACYRLTASFGRLDTLRKMVEYSQGRVLYGRLDENEGHGLLHGLGDRGKAKYPVLLSTSPLGLQ